MIQNTTLFVLNLNIIAYVLPVEDCSLALNSGRNLLGALVGLLSSADRLGAFDIIFRVASLRSVSSTEEQNLTLGLGLRDVLSADKVESQEEDHKTNHDAQVAPLVGVGVLEVVVEVVVTFNDLLAKTGTTSVANLVHVRFSVGRDKRLIQTSEVAIVEFVDHERLETISNGIDVIHPSGPAKHVGWRNGETGVDNETQNQDSGGDKSLREGSRVGGDRTENH